MPVIESNVLNVPFNPLLLISLLWKLVTELMLRMLKQFNVTVSFWRPKSKFFEMLTSSRLVAG